MSTGNSLPMSSEPIDGETLCVFINENDKHGRIPLHSWIVSEAQKRGLLAAYVFKSFEGFSLSGGMQTTKFVDLSCNLPLLVMIIDTREKISQFKAYIRSSVRRGLIVSQSVSYQGGNVRP